MKIAYKVSIIFILAVCALTSLPTPYAYEFSCIHATKNEFDQFFSRFVYELKNDVSFYQKLGKTTSPLWGCIVWCQGENGKYRAAYSTRNASESAAKSMAHLKFRGLPGEQCLAAPEEMVVDAWTSKR